ncbi:MAG: DUF1573 domain-containing protein [Planctomycetota bacterium]|jgi:hypothetical protein
MKLSKIFLGFAGCLAVFGVVLGLTIMLSRVKDNNISSSRGAVYCESPSFDIGKLYRPAPKTLQPRFKIRNTSKSLVTLRVAGTSCACSKATLIKTALEPDEETELCVDWDLSGIIGRSNFKVYVESDSHDLLILSGSVDVRDILILDKYGVALGDIKPGETKTAQITIKPWGGDSLSNEICIKDDTSMGSEFEVTEKTRTTDSIVFSVSVTGQPALGEKIYNLAIETGNSIQPVVEVPVTVCHLELYGAKPSVVVLGGIEGNGNSATKLVKIVSNCGLPVIIKRIAVDNESVISVSLIGAESSTDTVRLQRKEEKSDAPITGSVSIFVAGQEWPIMIRYVCM